MADDFGWEAVTLKGEPAHRASLISISLSGQPSLCDNAAAKVLGADHGVTMAFAKAAESMAPADLWLARIAIKTLRREVREAIAEAAES